MLDRFLVQLSQLSSPFCSFTILNLAMKLLVMGIRRLNVHTRF